jgi:glutamate dehydrogenase
VLGLAHDGPETHTGRSMRNVLETLPRDLVFELDSAGLAQLVIDVVNLQERQIVRVFDVPEPVGNRSTVLVFLPKQRFDAQLPERVAAAVGELYGSEATEVDSFLGASNLARITFTVERSDREVPDLDHVSDVVDQLTTAWIDRVHQMAVHELGEAHGNLVVQRAAAAAPASYRSSVDPAPRWVTWCGCSSSIDDDAVTRTALVRHVDDPDDQWRMRVYRQDEPIVLADLLPMLGHVGLVAIDEHPHRS